MVRFSCLSKIIVDGNWNTHLLKQNKPRANSDVTRRYIVSNFVKDTLNLLEEVEMVK